MSSTPPQIILAIESAIGGGSLSLLRDGAEVANWLGSNNISRAEDLLANIDAMLTANGVHSYEIDLIAVSAGPGSFTGIRIGLATALGLKAGLNVPMSSESALKAMAYVTSSAQNIITAVPVGRNAVCRQTFNNGVDGPVAVDEPQTFTEEEFLSAVKNENNVRFVLHSALYEKTAGSPEVTDFGPDIARAIGLICRENRGVTQPLFISKSF